MAKDRLPKAPTDPGVSTIKATPLMVKGIIFLHTRQRMSSTPARDVVWHFAWKGKEAMHRAHGGFGMPGFLQRRNRGHPQSRGGGYGADLKQEYFSTVAPIVIGNHVLVGVSGDSLDIPGFLEAHDPETGDIQWKWWSAPLKKGDPGFETWPDEYARRHGGGMTWVPGTYDPALHLYYLGTGNPNPVLTGRSRKGDNLYTCSIVALNVDTGKLAWYFQPSPHDTHDWDAAQTPVLIDAEIDGKPRKLLAQANRNGYFFLLDRTNGKNVLTAPMIRA